MILNKILKKTSSRKRHRVSNKQTNYQALEARHLLAGDFVWADSFSGTDVEVGYGIATDHSNHVYTFGVFSGTVDLDPGPGVMNVTAAGSQETFLTKVNSAGALVWAKVFTGTNASAPSAISVDSGSVYLTGTFTGTMDANPGAGTNNLNGTGDGWSSFVIRLDLNGNFGWGRSISATSFDLELGDEGAIYVAGSFAGTADFDPGAGVANLSSVGQDGFILKLDSGGNYVWAKPFAAFDSLSRMHVTGIVYQSGELIATGDLLGAVDLDPGPGTNFLSSTHGFPYAFVAKINSDGNHVWAKQTSGSGFHSGSDVDVDASGNVFVVGDFTGNGDFDPSAGTLTMDGNLGDAFVWKLTSDGNVLWAKPLGGAAPDSAVGLKVDLMGSVYIVGSFAGTADFNPGTAVSNLVSRGGSDGFVAKLNSNGAYLWARAIGGTQHDEINAIALDSQLNILTTGAYRGTVDFDPRGGVFNLTSVSSSTDAFTSKLTQDIVLRAHATARQITLRKNGANLQLVNDATGSIVFSRPAAHYLGATIGGVSVQSDRLTIDYGFGGQFFLPAGIRFNGGSGGADILRVFGTGIEEAIYSTGETVGKSHFLVTTDLTAILASITGTNLEGAKLANTRRTDYITLGSNDTLESTQVMSDFGTPAARITGTSGMTTVVPFTIGPTSSAYFYLGDFDLESAPNDWLKFNPGGFKVSGLRDLYVQTGIGDDQMSVNDADLRTPLEGEFWYFGGDGGDQLSVTGDTNLRINAARLASDAGGRILIDRIEGATLEGGDSNNQLIATGFPGSVALYGHGGNDILRGTAFTDSIYGGDGDDQIFGGQGDDFLIGGGGSDRFYLDGTSFADDLRLRMTSSTTASFERRDLNSTVTLESDFIRFDESDRMEIRALHGDDLIDVDLAFAVLGTVNGGDGLDTCTAPAAWTKISC